MRPEVDCPANIESEAATEILTVPETVDFGTGIVIETNGGVVSGVGGRALVICREQDALSPFVPRQDQRYWEG
jgi:hypothetical protein